MCWLMNSPLADLGVRQSVAGEPRDLSFLRDELIAGLDGACADMLPGFPPAALTPQPLAVEEVGAGEMCGVRARCVRRLVDPECLIAW